MPITRKQFQMGIDTLIEEWMKRIHRFLTEHKDTAFTAGELWIALYGEGPMPSDESQAFDEALEKLVDLHAAQRRKIRGTYYYSYGLVPLKI